MHFGKHKQRLCFGIKSHPLGVAKIQNNIKKGLQKCSLVFEHTIAASPRPLASHSFTAAALWWQNHELLVMAERNLRTFPLQNLLTHV